MKKKQLKKNILTNINHQVTPYLEKLKILTESEINKTYLKIIDRSLSDITEPLLNKVTDISTNLSPAENRVVQLIKAGKTVKEIAEILTIAENTVKAHKRKIREKIGIKSKKIKMIINNSLIIIHVICWYYYRLLIQKKFMDYVKRFNIMIFSDLSLN